MKPAKKIGAPIHQTPAATPSTRKATPMTTEAAARIQSANARQNGGQVARDSFAARAQRAAATTTPKKGKA
ncbi:MAG: hypothetical protein QG612_2868 [Pseudomonadota bacterium]|nr:hypothetical protein [Pseudomonadota bacterium]